MHGCPCCCQTCDRGYIRDSAYDEDTNRHVPVDYGCQCRKRGAQRCAYCRKNCDPVLGPRCNT